MYIIISALQRQYIRSCYWSFILFKIDLISCHFQSKHTQVNPLGSLLILWSDNLLDHISFMVWQIWYLAWTMTDDRLASGVCVCMHVCTCIYLCTYHMHVPYGMYACMYRIHDTWWCDFNSVVWWFQCQSPNFMLYTNTNYHMYYKS